MCENLEFLYTYKWKIEKRLQNIVYFGSNMKLKKNYIYKKRNVLGKYGFQKGTHIGTLKCC